MNNEKVIEILGLYVKYDDKTVLENINLEVYKNDFIGIIGPNGGGKSSLLKTILGLLPIAGGKISVFGNTPETGRKYIGYVPQENKFDWKYPIKVLDVVLSGRLKFKKNFYFYNKSDKKKAEETLDKLGMLKLKNCHISELSGGQKKRAFICRALVTDSEILMLDEPASDLDVHIETSVYGILKELNMTKTIILVTHDVGIISGYVKKVCCLNGKLFYHGAGKISSEMINEAYQCPVDLIAHGIPHRVFGEH